MRIKGARTPENVKLVNKFVRNIDKLNDIWFQLIPNDEAYNPPVNPSEIEKYILELIDKTDGQAIMKTRLRKVVVQRVAITKLTVFKFGRSKKTDGALARLLGMDRTSIYHYVNYPQYPEVVEIIKILEK